MAERGGQEGNDNAHKGAVYRRALKRALAIAADAAGKTPDYEEGLLLVAQSHVTKALAGDVLAADKIADRFDGKPSQSIDVNANVTARISEATDETLAAIALGVVK